MKEILGAKDFFSFGTKLLFGSVAKVEMPVNRMTAKVKRNAKKYSDTAIFYYGRSGSEGADLTEENLRLTKEERAVLDYVTREYRHVIVVFNVANMPEMGWLEEYDTIDAALMIGIPGTVGMQAVADVLAGKVNPSGRLTDTIAYQVEDHPSSANLDVYKRQQMARNVGRGLK